ncbi:Telomeric single stranded DNA binding POT1/Cdc13 [Lasallia pustulata]|uniref:Telomeric single stranded DNA binding POT1/Cdc13 n=1 Tax=Lasallia pustulata TaxID=136370 RepID=A0A1W5D477_9LECA|nr:Telomeric single stranded DNA binding POT1/Cdc13 [Lasallia pustulata]
MALADHFELQTHVPISELQPSVNTNNRCIRGVVTLIWPYSSSKGSLSLLLAEPDFRLRRQRGQIRLTFIGSSAKLVARSGVSSGDGLVLSLDAVQWAKDETTSSTPGKGSEWELRFGERAILRIEPESKTPVFLNIDHPALSPEPQVQSSTPPRSPTASEPPWIPNHRAEGRVDSHVWSSPAFLKRSRLSSASYLNSIYDPFLEEDGYLEGRSRKRTKFGRESGQWRYAERTPSPDRESEAEEVHGANQNRLLDPADETPEPTTVVEENRDLQESKEQERDIELIHEDSILTPVEGQTPDVRMTDSAVTAERETAEKEFPIVTPPEKHAVDGSSVSVSQQELLTVLPFIQRSSSAERSPVARDLLAAEGLGEVVIDGAAHVVVESGSPSQVDDSPDEHMHSADAQLVVREPAQRPPQLESLSSADSLLATRKLDREGDASPYLSRFGEQSEYYTVSDNALEDGHMNSATGAEEPSLSAQNNQQEATTVGAGPNNLSAKETIPGLLPRDSPIHYFSDLAAKNPSSGFDGGALSQPTNEDIHLGDRWDHVAAAHRSLEKPEEGSETRDSPSSHLFDTSLDDVGDDVTELITPNDGLNRTVTVDQEVEGAAADEDVDEFSESAALGAKSYMHHDPRSPQLPHAIDVEERFLSSYGSGDEEDGEEDDSEGQEDHEDSEDMSDEREDEDRNSGDWVESSDDDSIRLEEYSSFGSNESEVEGQVHLVKPPIEVINLEDDDEDDGGSPQDGLDEPNDLPVPNIPFTYLTGSGGSQFLQGDEAGDEHALSVESDSSQLVEEDEDRSEDILSMGSEPSQVWESDEVLDEDVLSLDNESSRELGADEVNARETLSVDSEAPQVLEVDEDGGEDVLSMNIELPQVLKADEPHEEDILSVASQASQSLEAEEDRGEDVLLMDNEQRQRTSYQVHRLVASTTILGLEVQMPETDTAGPQVGFVEHQTLEILVQEPKDETSHEVEVEIEQAIDSMLPMTDLAPGKTESIQESEQRHDILDPRLRKPLATPDATQPMNASSQRSLNGGQDLMTPRLTRSNSTDPLQSDAPLHQPRSSLLEKLNELKTSTAKRSQVQLDGDVPSAISPWFAPKQTSQIAPKNASDVESDHSDAQSEVDSDDSEDSEVDLKDLEKIQTIHVPTSTQPIPPPTGLRTSLSYFAPLASLESHFRSTLDVLAIVITSTQISRAKSGPRDYHVTIHFADPSTTTTSDAYTTAVSIFRPFKQALPLVQSGDAVLLRDFNVQRRKQRFMLLSTKNSAWAVFRTGEEAQIRGPPVEFAAAERGFARGLGEWWGSLAAEVKEKLTKEAAKEKEPDEGKGRWVDGKHELRDGTTYTDVPAEEKNAIHELRDGTTYVDEDV